MINKLLTALCAALYVASVPALQVIEVGEGATVYAKVSANDQTRIAVERGRLATFKVPSGKLILSPDDETGQMFLTVPPGSTKPISAFVITESGQTFTLVMTPTDLPAESVILRSPQTGFVQPVLQQSKKGAPFEVELKRLHLAMWRGERPEGGEVREVKKPVALWRETTMTLERQFFTPTIVGEEFSVTNVTTAPLVMTEPEFYKKGVHSVAIVDHTLAPGASTKVYVARMRSINE